MDGDKVKTHESFGLMTIGRSQYGKEQPLFGSSIGHSNVIRITLSKAEQVRSTALSCDRYYGNEELFEVEMSQTQFAEMITSMNYGSGTPVTIKKIQGKRMGYPEVENKRKQHSDEFRNKMICFGNSMEETQKKLALLLKKPKLSKLDKLEMKHAFEYLSTEVKSNIPFFEKQFEVQIDSTIAEAKAEIDSHITHAVTTTGLKELRKQGGILGIE